MSRETKASIACFNVGIKRIERKYFISSLVGVTLSISPSCNSVITVIV
jgi:hypothetical protein